MMTGAGAGGFGLPDWCWCERVDVAAAILWETIDVRRGLHRSRGCDTTLIVGGQDLLRRGGLNWSKPTGKGRPDQSTCGDCGRGRDFPGVADRSVARRFELSGDCACRGYLSDAFAEAQLFLGARPYGLNNPAAAVRTHLQKRQFDSIRTRRKEIGAQVRVDRLEESRMGKQLATVEQRWLLSDIADEAGSDAPLRDDRQLLERLAERRGARLGVAAANVLAAVERDREIVAAVASTGRRVDVGTPAHPERVSWWQAYVERPLGRRRSSTDVSLDAVPFVADRISYSVDPLDDGRSTDPSSSTFLKLLQDAAATGVSPRRALNRALTAMAALDPTEYERARVNLLAPDALARAVAEVADWNASRAVSA